MRRVIVESPYAGGWFVRRGNIRYARACLRDCLTRGETPLASHLLYTQRGVLRDGINNERKMGIEAGHAWIPVADAIVVYVDRGVSAGMERGIKFAEAHGIPIEQRSIHGGLSRGAERL